MENNWTTLLVLVVHEAAVLEMCYERRLALDARIGDLTFLLRIELFPLLVVELLIERNQ